MSDASHPVTAGWPDDLFDYRSVHPNVVAGTARAALDGAELAVTQAVPAAARPYATFHGTLRVTLDYPDYTGITA